MATPPAPVPTAQSLTASNRPRDPTTNQFLPRATLGTHPTVSAAKRAFVAALAEVGTMRGAALHAGIHLWQVYRWKEDDPDFAEAVDSTFRQFASWHESQLVRISQGDGMPAVVSNLARLKALDPEHYVERHITITRDETGSGMSEFARLALERLRQLVGPEQLPAGPGEPEAPVS